MRFLFGALLSAVLAAGQAPDLSPGRVVEGVAVPGEVEWHSIRLEAGQFCNAAVEQRDADLSVTVLDPAGATLARFDSFERGLEPVPFQAVSTGLYRLGVSAKSKGSYDLEVLEVRAPEALDASLSEGARHSTAAKRLLEEGTAGSLRASIEESEGALPHWRRLRDRPAELATLIRMGDAFHALSEYGSARDRYQAALPISRELHDHQSEGEILNDLGTGYWREGRTDEAIQSLEGAAAIWKEFGFRYEGAATASNLGILLWQSGEWQDALGQYLPALETVRSLGNRLGEAYLLNNIGAAYHSLGETQEALDYLNRALALFRTLENRAAAGRTLGLIGRIHLAAGSVRQALECEREALQLARTAGDARTEAMTLNSLGMVYDAQGNRALAQDDLQLARAESQALNDQRGEAVALQNLAHIEPDPVKAMDLLTRSLDLNIAIGARDSQAETLYAMARVACEGGRLAESRSRIEAALDLTESLRGRVAGPSFRTSYFAAKQDYYRFYIDLLMQQGEDAGAFSAAERTRGRSLLDTLAEIGGEIRQGVDPALQRRQRALERQLNFMAEKGAGRQDLDRAIAEMEALEAQIRASSPHYADLLQPQPVSLEAVQHSILDADTMLLEYSLGADCSYLWAVTSQKMKSYRLPARSIIEKAARRVSELAGERPRGSDQDWRTAALALSRMVLWPASAQLRAKRLAIVSDGALQYVPWAAVPGPRGVPLAVDYEIVGLPCVSLVPLLRREIAARKPAPRSLVVLADPVFGADDPRVAAPAVQKTPALYARLPFTRLEAQGILSVAPPDAMSLLDFDASKQALTSARMGSFRVLHIATHSVLDDARPQLSAVILSGVDRLGRPVDGVLRLQEVYNMVLPIDTLVLSACQTGLGTDVRGEGLIGLTRGFMYAGAARVVVSLWRVDDAATAELMKRFYQGLYGAQSLRPAAALRAAQLFVSGQKRWAAPFFWAGFVLQGEWR